MKKYIMLFSFWAVGQFSFAQIYVDGVKLDITNTGHYLELDPLFKTDGQCTFKVDFGQSNPKEDFITDQYGKKFDFRSLIDGLNYFYDNGWEVAQISQNERGRRFLLKRKN
jgi:hypothetical protein